MFGEPLSLVDRDHPWATVPLGDDGGARRSAFAKRNEAKHEGHYCYLPAVDLLVLQQMSFGLDEEDYWKHKVSGLFICWRA